MQRKISAFLQEFIRYRVWEGMPFLAKVRQPERESPAGRGRGATRSTPMNDAGDNLIGYFTKSETETVSGKSYSGSFEVTFYDLDGNIQFQHDGTLTAVRITSH
jgi:hypothetical protein